MASLGVVLEVLAHETKLVLGSNGQEALDGISAPLSVSPTIYFRE